MSHERGCIVCGAEKPLEDYPTCKFTADGLGRATICRACSQTEGGKGILARERVNAKRKVFRDEHGITAEADARAERRVQREAGQEVLRRERQHLYEEQKLCLKCGEVKYLAEFPRNGSNLLGDGGGRSRVCKACYAAMPDGGKASLARERARDYHRLHYARDAVDLIRMETIQRERALDYTEKRQAMNRADAHARWAADLGITVEEYDTMDGDKLNAMLLARYLPPES